MNDKRGQKYVIEIEDQVEMSDGMRYKAKGFRTLFLDDYGLSQLVKTSGKSIDEWQTEIHDNAVEHGWWGENRSLPEVIALCHSELSEALEEYRDGKMMYYVKDGKPEGIATEMIDCIIRILDYLGHEHVQTEEIMAAKHEYNKTRPYKHGGKKI